MRILKPILAALCVLALGAHFLRYGHTMLMLGFLLIVPLAFLPWRWARWTVATALALGSLEWLRTLLTLRTERITAGMPALRMTLILAGVALLTACSAWWLAAPARKSGSPPQGS